MCPVKCLVNHWLFVSAELWKFFPRSLVLAVGAPRFCNIHLCGGLSTEQSRWLLFQAMVGIWIGSGPPIDVVWSFISPMPLKGSLSGSLPCAWMLNLRNGGAFAARFVVPVKTLDSGLFVYSAEWVQFLVCFRVMGKSLWMELHKLGCTVTFSRWGNRVNLPHRFIHVLNLNQHN